MDGKEVSGERHGEYQYLDLLKDIIANGVEKKDHNTGNSLTSVFGRQIRFDLSKGFPLLTTKKVYWNGVLHELLWFLKGMTNIKYLVDKNVHIWDDYPYKIYMDAVARGEVPEISKDEFIGKIKADDGFAKIWGEMPKIYGELWRSWPASDGRKIDQIAWIIDTLKKFPERKHAVFSVWNPEYLYSMATPGKALRYPLCHILVHFNVANNKLSAQLYQRSCDMFLGVPFNIASYALLTQIVAHICGYEPGDFVHTFGDVHIYSDHMNQVKEQISREPKSFPRVVIDPSVRSIEELEAKHITLEGYEPYGVIKAPLTVAGGFDEKDREKYDFGKKN